MGMTTGDFADAFKSTSGAAMTAAAAALMPGANVMAYVLAAMQTTVISDATQLAHAASRHDDLAKLLTSYKSEIDDHVNKIIPPSQFSSADKDTFTTAQVEPAKANLDAAAAVHTNAASTLRAHAATTSTMGDVSFGTGLAMGVLAASTVAQEATLVGIPAALAEQWSGSSILSSIFRTALTLLKSIIGIVAKLLSTNKLALAGLGIAEVTQVLPQVMTPKPTVTPATTMTYTQPPVTA